MLDALHSHMTEELRQGSRTDTVFMVVAIFFDLVVLGINTTVAIIRQWQSGPGENTLVSTTIFFILVAMTVVVNLIAVGGLLLGRRTRLTLLAGLTAMYSDMGVDKYYDRSLLRNYGTRYTLFIGVVVALGAAAVLVPMTILVL